MQLNKTQALFLSKILFHYKLHLVDLAPHLEEDIDVLLHGLETFLTGAPPTGGDADEDYDDEDDDEDDDDEDAAELEPLAIDEVKATDLHDLEPSLKVSTGELEFEFADETDVLVNGYAEVHNIKYVCRKTDSLQAWENGSGWHAWQVAKTPKSWKRLKLDVVYRVVNK